MPKARSTKHIIVNPLASTPVDESQLIVGDPPGTTSTEVITTMSVSSPPKTEELTPEQRQIRDLQDQLAKERGRKDPEPEYDVITNSDDQGNIVIHFLEDGITALGKVWCRGQELEFAPGSKAYNDTCDRYGRSWLDLRTREFDQVERWGKVMFRPGPWPGKSLLDVASQPFDVAKGLKDGERVIPTEEELLAAQKAEAKRRRAAPRLPAM